MSNQVTTSWILDLVDKMTKPMRNAFKSATSLSDAMDDVTSSITRTEKEAKEALGKAQEHFKDTKTSVKKLEDELQKLEQAYEKATPGQEKLKAQEAYEKAKQKVEQYRVSLHGAEQDVISLTGAVEKFTQKQARWQDTITGINQGIELMQKANDSMSFAADIKDYSTEVQRLTGLQGEALDEFVAKAMKLKKLEGADPMGLLRSANAMTQFNGGGLIENLDLIKEGYDKAANSNGNYTDQLFEYQGFVKQLGMTQRQYIAFISQSNKMGVFNDKAIDSMKEANMALREMQKPQVDALAGIGLTPKDIEGKTSMDAIKLISEKMKTASTQARQLVMADIFKGAGEDATEKFVEALSTMDLDLTKLPAVERSASGFRSWISDLSTSAGQMFGNVATYSRELMPMFMIVSSAIPIVQMLSKVTWIQTIATKAQAAAQWLLNAAMTANPVGLIIAGVAALIAIIALCWTKFEGFRTVIFKAWEAMKLFGNVIKDYVVNRFKELLSGLTGVAKAIGHLFKGEWQKAWDTGKNAVTDLMGVKSGAKAASEFKNGWNGAMQKGDLASKEYTAKQKAKEKEKAPSSVNAHLNYKPDVLGAVAPDDKTKKKGGKAGTGEGLNVGSGSNGIRSIVQTLNITNNFSVSKDTNVRDLADKVVSYLADGLRDSVINIGG